MKFMYFLTVLILAVSCSKQDQEPCAEGSVICTQILTTGWTICPDPETGKPVVTNYTTYTTKDTVAICDTLSWLKDKQDTERLLWELAKPEDKKLIEQSPQWCGCY